MPLYKNIQNENQTQQYVAVQKWLTADNVTPIPTDNNLSGNSKYIPISTWKMYRIPSGWCDICIYMINLKISRRDKIIEIHITKDLKLEFTKIYSDTMNVPSQWCLTIQLEVSIAVCKELSKLNHFLHEHAISNMYHEVSATIQNHAVLSYVSNSIMSPNYKCSFLGNVSYLLSINAYMVFGDIFEFFWCLTNFL